MLRLKLQKMTLGVNLLVSIGFCRLVLVVMLSNYWFALPLRCYRVWVVNMWMLGHWWGNAFPTMTIRLGSAELARFLSLVRGAYLLTGLTLGVGVP